MELELDVTEARAIPYTGSLYDTTWNGILVESREQNEDAAPVPWDAGVSIDGENLVISGGLGASGYGSCEVRLPKKDANEVYRIYVEAKEGFDEITRPLLEAAGVKIVAAVARTWDNS